MTELGIKCLLAYLQAFATSLILLLFSSFLLFCSLSCNPAWNSFVFFLHSTIMTTGSTLKDRIVLGISFIILHLNACPNKRLWVKSEAAIISCASSVTHQTKKCTRNLNTVDMEIWGESKTQPEGNHMVNRHLGFKWKTRRTNVSEYCTQKSTSLDEAMSNSGTIKL